MRPLNILITNNALSEYAGSELYVRDVALSLRKRGHRPIAYSQILGRLSEEIQAAGVPVTGDLRTLTLIPDIIHGQHNLETMTALLHFPHTPAICFCHGYVAWQGHPPVFPRIMRYVAVDRACLDRLYENGIHPSRVEVLLNFVDLQRFQPRQPLPRSPRKALVFSNYLTENNGLPIIREACRRAGIQLDAVGLGSGRPCYQPEMLLPGYDLVFAKARAAIEALAVGCAVITCDASGFGSMVTTKNIETLRSLNFGFRTLTRPMDLEIILNEIKGYDALEAQEVSSRLRKEADMNDAVDRLLTLYQEAIDECGQMMPSREAEEKAAAGYLGWLATQVKGFIDHNQWARRESAPNQSLFPCLDLHGCYDKVNELYDHSIRENSQLKTSLETLRGSVDNQVKENMMLKASLETLRDTVGHQAKERAQLQELLNGLYQSTSWRITWPLRKVKSVILDLVGGGPPDRRSLEEGAARKIKGFWSYRR